MNSPENVTENRASLAHDEIARRAEEIWREYGSPQGRDEEIWFEAERQLSQKSEIKSPAAENMKSAEITARPARVTGDPKKRRTGAAR